MPHLKTCEIPLHKESMDEYLRKLILYKAYIIRGSSITVKPSDMKIFTVDNEEGLKRRLGRLLMKYVKKGMVKKVSTRKYVITSKLIEKLFSINPETVRWEKKLNVIEKLYLKLRQAEKEKEKIEKFYDEY